MQQTFNGELPCSENSEESVQKEWQEQPNLNGEVLTLTPLDSLSHKAEVGFDTVGEEFSTKKRWEWTGFADKKLWDWLQFVSAVAASIALPIIFTVYTSQQQASAEKNRKQEYEIAISNQFHEILADYFDDMTELMLEENLGATSSSNQVKLIASARTLNTLRQLDGGRKGQLLKFLYEAELIGTQCQTNFTTLVADNCQKPILDLNGAKLEKITIESSIPLQGIDLTRASLFEANLPQIDLTKAEMKEANLKNANLTGALLSEARMERTNLEHAVLTRAFLRGANLSNSNLTDANLQDAAMGRQKVANSDGTFLPGIILTNATLRNTNLKGADLTQSRLNSANLQEANLSNAILAGANLQNSNLERANLSNANLQGSDLRDADLTDATLEGTDLKESRYNNSTKFPEGFNPDGQGMHRVD